MTGPSARKARSCIWRSIPSEISWPRTSHGLIPATGRRSAGSPHAVQAATGESVEVAFIDQGYNSPNAAAGAKANGIDLIVVMLPEAKKGFVLLPRRWVVQRCFVWATRFGVWSKTTNAMPARWPDFTLSHSFA